MASHLGDDLASAQDSAIVSESICAEVGYTNSLFARCISVPWAFTQTPTLPYSGTRRKSSPLPTLHLRS